MLLAMLAIAESLRVQQYVRFMTDSDLNSGVSANVVGRAGANDSARNSELQATLADPSAQELARSLTQQNEILLAQMAGDPKLQEGIRGLKEEVSAMMADPLVQAQAARLAEEVEEAMVNPNFQEQAKQLLEQAKGVATQMQAMMTDPRLQSEAERAAEQIMKGITGDRNEEAMEATEAMEALKANPIFVEYKRRLLDELEGMQANHYLPGLVAPIAQLMTTLVAEPNIQSYARRIATRLEGMSAQLTSQSTDGGSSLAEIGRSSSGVAFLPRRHLMRKPLNIASRGTASQHPRSEVRMATRGGRSSQPKSNEIGATRPLGFWDPLQLREQGPERYRRFQEMEIKHGRLAMAACLGVLVTLAGIRFPGYLSLLSFPPLKFEDVPGGTISAVEAVPQLGWAQIVTFIALLEVGVFKQDPLKESGDVVPDNIPWVRYDDKDVREFKLNAERNNGRAAMIGIIGMIIHEVLTGNPIFPIAV